MVEAAVLLLALPGLVVPPESGLPATVRHRGDASLLTLPTGWAPDQPAEMRFAARMILGDLLDRHDDPRGVLAFPETLDPVGDGYAALVGGIGAAGLWLPWPEEAPAAFPDASPAPEAALQAEMVAALGISRAEDLMLPLEVAIINTLARPGTDSGEAAAERAMADAMGAGFAARYAAALRLRIHAEIARGTAPPPLVLD